MRDGGGICRPMDCRAEMLHLHEIGGHAGPAAGSVAGWRLAPTDALRSLTEGRLGPSTPCGTAAELGVTGQQSARYSSRAASPRNDAARPHSEKFTRSPQRVFGPSRVELLQIEEAGSAIRILRSSMVAEGLSEITPKRFARQGSQAADLPASRGIHFRTQPGSQRMSGTPSANLGVARPSSHDAPIGSTLPTPETLRIEGAPHAD